MAYVRATSVVGDAKGWGLVSAMETAPPDRPSKPAAAFLGAAFIQYILLYTFYIYIYIVYLYIIYCMT